MRSSNSPLSWSALLAASLVGAGCSGGPVEPAASSDAGVSLTYLADSPSAREVVARARSRFLAASPPEEMLPGVPQSSARMPLIAPPAVNHFERGAASLVPRILSPIGHVANVTLPATADGAFQLNDPATGATASVRLVGAASVPAAGADGYVVYENALPDGASWIHRVSERGVEDFISFDREPARSEVRYELRPGTGVAGLRFVANSLELVDTAGAPRLRIAPPSIAGSDGHSVTANLSVEGCAVDTDPAAPWGRQPTAPGADKCVVRVSWSNAAVKFPALLDPTWSLTGSLATARAGHSTTLLANGRVLVAGGFDNSVNGLASAELYDPATGTWASTGPLLQARHRFVDARLPSGSVLVCGGGSDITVKGLKTCELYNPTTGTFAAAASMANGRYSPTLSTLSSGLLLVVGGKDETATVSATSELYNPTTGTFTATGSINFARNQHSATVLNTGSVLICGGGQPGVTNTCELYSPTAGTWTQCASMSSFRSAHSAVLLDSGKVLIAGGFNTTSGSLGYPLNTELYDPSSNTFSNAGSFTTGRNYIAMTKIPGGVVASGGYNGTGAVNNSEFYFESSASWTPGSLLNNARYNHGSVLLNTGRVLIVGGYASATLASAETVTPATPPGNTCTTASDCLSGFCVDGVCCNSACTDQCAACNVTGKVGTCSPRTGAPVGGRPACTTDGSACGGTCNGTLTTACTYPSTTVSCRTASCTNNVATKAATCNGSGACGNLQTTACSPYKCGSTACLTTCTSSANCQTGYGCVAGTCVPTLSNGSACNVDGACGSGFCVTGYCCDKRCNGTRMVCNLPGSLGVCTKQ